MGLGHVGHGNFTPTRLRLRQYREDVLPVTLGQLCMAVETDLTTLKAPDDIGPRVQSRLIDGNEGIIRPFIGHSLTIPL
jgi:hypothetical protein